MTYLTVENLSKHFGERTLFENITFGMSKGDKTALIAPNGTGKSTLLKIIAGEESQSSGEVMLQSDVRIGYLKQEPELNPALTINEYILQGDSDITKIVREYERATDAQAADFNEKTQDAFMKASSAMDAAGAWDFEQRMQQILGKLEIHDLERLISSLSGGEKKRVALAFVLINSPDLILLDEPTNHLDLDMIEWLEEYLERSTLSLLMVTHDRYFLERVCNEILEMDNGVMYRYKGNFSYFLEKKAERHENEAVTTEKAQNLLKKELD